MSELIQQFQMKVKVTSTGLMVFTARLLSGLILGLTVTLVGQEATGYGAMTFWFVLIVVTTTFVRLSRSWSASGVLIFDLIAVLMALVLRMYILIAPG
ncbi:MAG: hypothetical protein K2X47_14360 [Bdellovibrionales bacterium]|nr:hypothetical protein [Bdellovibrionales bacterium]